jgi:hypothetical protein
MKTMPHRGEELPFRGVDQRPEDRPGVPREVTPRPLEGARFPEPARQPVEGEVLLRPPRAEPTPVFSTALPTRGLSGRLRRIAYTIPDHLVRQWMLLLVADRVDVLEARLLGPRSR